MSRPNRVFLFLAFPSLVLLWGIGWLLYWIGIQREYGKPRKSSTPNDLQIFVSTPEEKHMDEDILSESLEA